MGHMGFPGGLVVKNSPANVYQREKGRAQDLKE